MARPPKIRAHYSADAQFLLRLLKAVEGDKTRPLKWRKNIIERLQTLAVDLLNAPAAALQPPADTKQ